MISGIGCSRPRRGLLGCMLRTSDGVCDEDEDGWKQASHDGHDEFRICYQALLK